MVVACPIGFELYCTFSLCICYTCPGNSSAGEPDEHYIRALKRDELAGVHVGEKYHTAQHPVQEFSG